MRNIFIVLSFLMAVFFSNTSYCDIQEMKIFKCSGEYKYFSDIFASPLDTFSLAGLINEAEFKSILIEAHDSEEALGVAVYYLPEIYFIGLEARKSSFQTYDAEDDNKGQLPFRTGPDYAIRPFTFEQQVEQARGERFFPVQGHTLGRRSINCEDYVSTGGDQISVITQEQAAFLIARVDGMLNWEFGDDAQQDDSIDEYSGEGGRIKDKKDSKNPTNGLVK